MRKEDRVNRRATEAEVLTHQEISKRKVRLSLTVLVFVSESTGSQAQAKSGSPWLKGSPCPYRESAGLGADLSTGNYTPLSKKNPEAASPRGDTAQNLDCYSEVR